MKVRTAPVTKFELLVGAVLLLVSGLLLYAALTPGHDWGGDFAGYIHQGKSLATGSVEHLRMLVQYRVENSSNEYRIGPSFYPWGFPAALAAVIAVFGESVLAMKLLIVGFVLGCQAAIYLLLRGRTSMVGCYAVTFVFAVNSFVCIFINNVLSDIPFTFFAILTLLLCRKFLLQKNDPSMVSLICIGISMFIAFSIRTHAIALVPTVAILQVLGKTDFETRAFVPALLRGLMQVRMRDLVPYLVFAFGAAAVSATLSSSIESYVMSGDIQMGPGIVERTVHSVRGGVRYYGALPNSLFNAPKVIYLLVLGPILLFGVLRSGLKNLDLLLFVAFHMLILLMFPGRQGLRFVLPVLPILFFFLFVGGCAVGGQLMKLRSKAQSAMLVDVVAAAILVVGVSGPATVQVVTGRLGADAIQTEAGPYTESSRDMFEYIRRNVREEESIVFWKPRVLSYLTGLKSAFVYEIDDLVSGRFGYVLVLLDQDPAYERGQSVVDVASTNPQYFRLVYNNLDFALYEILTSDTQ